ncbi:hypothetical protein SAMN05660862_0346 [Sphingobacterium psychroaquaticum]|uniref:Uncharacterized protein n=1 Tax=Sphingobacterium psychroaquaticum TaxID=561061 RepID=A0A1X7I184_9SPHI|nr:hypothetical protein SAMN05660862_0346 [Sphingobacterium psychroaquaticum]
MILLSTRNVKQFLLFSYKLTTPQLLDTRFSYAEPFGVCGSTIDPTTNNELTTIRHKILCLYNYKPRTTQQRTNNYKLYSPLNM